MPPLPQLDLERVRALLADRFRIEEILGAGASGAVLRARTLTPWREVAAGVDVALKVLRPERAADEHARSTLLREAELGQRVSDPHVVRIFGLDEASDAAGSVLFLVSELVRGRSLRDRIERSGAIVGDLARRIAEQAALGLAALHDAGIVHRDVKPENLLITDDRAEVRLADLGLARLAPRTEDRARGETGSGGPRASSSGGFFGSLAYAAPEVLRGEPPSPASDLYALGIVLFELLTARHPFGDARDADELLWMQLEVEPPRASHLEPRTSVFLETMVAELLRKAPNDRPQPASALARIFGDGEASSHWRARERSAPALASRRRLLALQRTRHCALVGREDERRTLDRAFKKARDGSGSSLLLTGHAGSGRRRLLDECIERWIEQHRDVNFLGAIAENEPTTRIAAPFGDLICDVLLEGERNDAPRAKERITERAQEVLAFDTGEARLLGELCAGNSESLSPDRGARADLLARAIARIVSRSAVTVLRIDRADRLNSTAARVVDLLLSRALAMPLLLVLVGPSGIALERFVDAVLPIGALDLEDFLELGRALFRKGEAPLELLRAAHETLDGQPRALIESLEECVAEGKLRGRPGDLFEPAPNLAELRPARPALQRIRERIERLPASARHVLMAAAVLGDRFRLDDLTELTRRPALDVLEALASFDNRVTGIEGGIGRFRHRAYRQATLKATPEGTLRILHRDAAWVKEDRGAAALEVGMHLSRAGEDAACLEPLTRGLETLVNANVRHSTVRVAERIRAHLNRLPRSERHNRQRLRWLLLTGRAHLQRDQEELGTRAFKKAILLARHLADIRSHADAVVGLAEFAQLNGRFLAAIQLLTSAESMLPTTADPTHETDEVSVTRARALMIHARVLAYLGDALNALKLANEALRTLPAGHDSLEAHLRIDYGRWLALRLHFVRALGEFDRALELADGIGDAYGELRAHLHRGRVLGTLGKVRSARAEFAIAHEMASRLDDARTRGRARLFHAELDVFRSEFDDARLLLQDAIEEARRAHDDVMEQHARALLVIVDDSEPAPAEPPHLGAPLADLSWLCALGLRARREGRVDAAVGFLREASSLERRARVTFLMRLFLLRAAGRDVAAGRLIATAIDRMPTEYRRRFLGFVERVRPADD
ncbi:MAG: protein kinase [Planctomycetota bacterium]